MKRYYSIAIVVLSGTGCLAQPSTVSRSQLLLRAIQNGDLRTVREFSANMSKEELDNQLFLLAARHAPRNSNELFSYMVRRVSGSTLSAMLQASPTGDFYVNALLDAGAKPTVKGVENALWIKAYKPIEPSVRRMLRMVDLRKPGSNGKPLLERIIMADHPQVELIEELLKNPIYKQFIKERYRATLKKRWGSPQNQENSVESSLYQLLVA